MHRNTRVGLFVGGSLGSVLLLACSSPSRETGERLGETQQAVVAGETKKFSISLPSGVPIGDAAVASSRTLKLADRARVQSSIGALLPVANAGTSSGGATELGVEAQSGTILSASAVTLRDRARVNGNIESGGVIVRQVQTVVTGTALANSAPSFDRWSWTVHFPPASQSVSVPPAATQALDPGSFENVTVYGGSTLRLRTGTYYLKSLDLESQSHVLVDTTQGPVFVYVRSGLIWRGHTNFTGPSDRLLVGYSGTESFAIESPFYGTLAAPDATVRLAVGGTAHQGALFAKDVQLDPDVELTLRPFAGWEAVQFDIVPRFECAQIAPNGTRIATFGYFNPNSRPVTVPVGAGNRFSLAPVDRRQPTTFLTGSRSNNFSIAYSGSSPSWQLNGGTAAVNTGKTCSTSFEVTATQDASLSAPAPRANFGSATSLQVSSTHQAVVGFDPKPVLATRGQGRFIKQAWLEIPFSLGTGHVVAHPMRSEWVESSVTFTCANDRDASSTGTECHAIDRWNMIKQADSYENPYDPDTRAEATVGDGKVVIDVTADLQDFLSKGHIAPSWALLSRDGTSSILGSREGNLPARLVVQTVSFTDVDFAGTEPFAVGVDTSLATNETLPGFADGQPRPLASLKPSGRPEVRFVEDELIVSTDSPTDLAAIKARWNATEIAAPQTSVPGIPKPHVLRIDTSRANEATLVPNIRERINVPSGLQKVSSPAALRLLAAAADEHARGTVVGINWLGQSAEVDYTGFRDRTFTDGPATNEDGVETSSNVYDWEHLRMHGVIDAWALLFFNDKMRPDIDVAILDAGFAGRFVDAPHAEVVGCASGMCENDFDCSNDSPCPWHGTHVANAGFGEPNNQYGGAGPAGAVTDLNLVYGFGDPATLLLTLPGMIIGGEDIINSSTAMPVPDYLSWSTVAAEQMLWGARKVGTMVFAAAEFVNADETAVMFNL